MRRIKTSKINNTQYYTLNDTTESDSITSKAISTKNSKNSDTSYQPSTNDNSTSPSLNKINADSKNLRTSNEFIQQNLMTSTNNNNTSSTNTSPKFQNNKLRQKNKIIPSNYHEHHHQKTASPTVPKIQQITINKT